MDKPSERKPRPQMVVKVIKLILRLTQRGVPPEEIKKAMLAVAQLRSRHRQADRQLRAFLAGLTPEVLDQRERAEIGSWRRGGKPPTVR